MNPYESNKLLNEYLLFHYGAPEQILPWDSGPESALNFAVRTVRDTIDWNSIPETARALDIGCAVGRSSFEFSIDCSEVIGIDYSQSFVDAADQIRNKGSLSYKRLEEGSSWTDLGSNSTSQFQVRYNPI